MAKREWQPSDHGQPAAAPTDGRAAPPEAVEGGQARAARALFQVSCAGCHGMDGRGGGPQLPPGAKPPNLADAAAMAARSDDALAEVIRKGRGLMPAFEDKLSAAGIEAMVAYVRGLSAPAGTPPPTGQAPTQAAPSGAQAPAAQPAPTQPDDPAAAPAPAQPNGAAPTR